MRTPPRPISKPSCQERADEAGRPEITVMEESTRSNTVRAQVARRESEKNSSFYALCLKPCTLYPAPYDLRLAALRRIPLLFGQLAGSSR